MPVMEGKCVLFKEFGDVDAIPLCVRSKDVDDCADRSPSGWKLRRCKPGGYFRTEML